MKHWPEIPSTALRFFLAPALVLLWIGTVAAATADHLLISEVASLPNSMEFVEIYNPTGSDVDISDYYLALMISTDEGKRYFDITDGTYSPQGKAYLAKFPDGSSISAGDAAVVAVYGTAFEGETGITPDFEIYQDGSNDIDNMVDPGPGWIHDSTAGQMRDDYGTVVLFHWDGASDLVDDVDIFLYGDESTAIHVVKTGVSKDGPDGDTDTSTYLDDTPAANQEFLDAPLTEDSSYQRPNGDEGDEPSSSGNGITGHDETGEPLLTTWQSDIEPTPGFVGINLLPTAEITSPSDGDTLPLGPVTLTGTGTDPEDGSLTGASLEWRSDDAGLLGTGETLEVAEGVLSPGPREITLTAVDSKGSSAVDTVQIHYGIPPIPEITSPVQGERDTTFTVGDTLWCSANAVDKDGNPLPASKITWTSHRDGALTPPGGYDASHFPYIPGGLGATMLTIAVEDNDGLVAGDSVTVVTGDEYITINELISNTDLYEGEAVTVLATLMMEKGTANEWNGYLQDDSGYGILAYYFDDLELERWEMAEIHCTLELYEGDPELTDFGPVTPVTDNLKLQAEAGVGGQPFVISTAEANSDRWNATTVTVEGIITSAPDKAGPGWNIDIDDGTGPALIRLWESTGIDPERFQLNSKMRITGIGSLYMTSYQLVPGYEEDVVLITDLVEAAPSATLTVPAHPFAPELGETLEIGANAPLEARAVLTLYDLRGKKVYTLFDGELHGELKLFYDGRDHLRRLLSPGTYILFLDAIENGSGRRTTDSAPVVIGVRLK